MISSRAVSRQFVIISWQDSLMTEQPGYHIQLQLKHTTPNTPRQPNINVFTALSILSLIGETWIKITSTRAGAICRDFTTPVVISVYFKFLQGFYQWSWSMLHESVPGNRKKKT